MSEIDYPIHQQFSHDELRAIVEEAAEMMVEHDAILVPTRFIVDQLFGMEGAVPAYADRKAVVIADRHEMVMKIAVAARVNITMGHRHLHQRAHVRAQQR